MSTYLTVTAMVSDLQKRVPIGLSTQYWTDRLNESYRWVIQRTPVIWNLKSIALTGMVTATGRFDMPPSFDPGKPCYLYNVLGSTAVPFEVPFKPYDQILKEQYTDTTAITGVISAWTFLMGASGYVGQVYPTNALTATAAPVLVYHILPTVTFTAGAYFPSPDEFDEMYMELAEARALRRQRMSGWDIIQKSAQDTCLALIEQYRSTKNSTLGLVEQARQTNESQAMKGE